MPEIGCKAFENFLVDSGKVSSVPVFLIHGDEYLYQSAYKSLVEALLPDSSKQHNLEQSEGGEENVSDILESLNTFSFLSGFKVIALCDSRVFSSQKGDAKALEKAKSAYDKQDTKKAARLLAALLGRLGLNWEDAEAANRQTTMKQVLPENSEAGWLDELVSYGMENTVAIPPRQDLGALLQQAIEKGFPQKNRLIITTDAVDKRKSLYKLIKEKGVVVDCTVPQGSRQADRKIQQEVIDQVVGSILQKSSKQMDRGALAALTEMTGFDLRAIAGGLEKLVSYVGDRPRIITSDVHAVLQRTKEDPIFELTGAVAERRYEKALFYLKSLLDNNFHPLQVLAALINQVRKLLLAKDFVESHYGKSWMPGMPYSQFKSAVMKGVQAYDEFIQAAVESWEPTSDRDAGSKKKGKTKGTDLVLARNPNSPYPVYQLISKSDLFSQGELVTALMNLQQADWSLKSSGNDPKLGLEQVILKMCIKSSRMHAGAR